jgi:hypothetical protein
MKTLKYLSDQDIDRILSALVVLADIDECEHPKETELTRQLIERIETQTGHKA